LAELGDEKMSLTELRADRPAGFRVAINRVLGAIVLLFPIGRGRGKKTLVEPGVRRSEPVSRETGPAELELRAPAALGTAHMANSSRMKLPVWPQRPGPFLGKLGSGKTSSNTAVTSARLVEDSNVMVS
jgi:hypothetical protein